MPDKKRFADLPFLSVIIPVILGITLIVINVIRIINIPITCDENGYDGKGAFDTYIGLMQDKFGSANNHIFHSVLRKFFVDNFGNCLFTLRVDSLIAQIFFLVFSYLICRHLFKNKWWLAGSFVIMNLASPLIFDFWGLSRGYGLGMSCMTISIYYLLRYMWNGRMQLLAASLGGAILSAYSNFGYINYFLSLGAVLILQQILFGKDKPLSRLLKEWAVMVAAAALLALMITGPLQAVYKNGELAFMGSAGFVKDTVTSLASDGLFLNIVFDKALVNIVVTFAFCSTCLSVLYWFFIYTRLRYRNNVVDDQVQYGLTFVLLLVMPALSLIAQYNFFSINYLTDRAALFFIMLFVLQLIYLLYYLRAKMKVVSTVLFGLLFGLVCYHFASRVNVNTTRLWYYNAGDLAILRRINSETKGWKEKVRICADWHYETSFKYDMEHYYPGRFEPVKIMRGNVEQDSTFDYYFITAEDVPNFPAAHYHRDTDVIWGSVILFRRN